MLVNEENAVVIAPHCGERQNGEVKVRYSATFS